MKRHLSYQDISDRLWSDITRRATVRDEFYSLHLGNALKVLRNLPDKCVHTCLTSPPYWGARDYEHPDQIGLEENLNDYITNLVSIFREIRRILMPGGTAWLNIGDCYYHGAGTINGRPPKKGWCRNKQLALVPYRVALALEDDGWWIRNNLVWHKPNAMPSSVRDRMTNTWEPFFLLCNDEHYYFDLDAIRIPHQTDDTIEKIRAEAGNNNGKAKGKNELRRWLNSPRHRVTIDGIKEVV